MDYSSPNEYEIADITITGTENIQKEALIGLTGLAVGHKDHHPRRRDHKSGEEILGTWPVLRCENLCHKNRGREDMVKYLPEGKAQDVGLCHARSEQIGDRMISRKNSMSASEARSPKTFSTISGAWLKIISWKKDF